MLKIVVCDDEFSVFEQISEHIQYYSVLKDREYEIHYCSTAQELLDTKFSYNLLFLDIMLNDGHDGIAIGKQLRSAGNTALFVLVTSRKDRALDGYEANVFRYLVKPVGRDKIYEVLDAMIENIGHDRNVVAVKFKYQTSYVDTKDIFYVESYLRKRYIVTRENKYETTAPMQSLMEQFSKYPNFFIPRKTHLINFLHVIAQSQVAITMRNGEQIRFAEGKYELFLVEFSKFLKKV